MNKELKVVNLLHKWMLMALVLTMLPRRNSFNFGYNKGNGNYCGQPHGSRGEGGGRNQSKNKLICQVYRKPGHIALKCYHRFDLSYQGQEVAANANSTNTSSTTYTNPQAYMTAPSSSDPNNNS
ncbi:hypothetical protein CK203_039900 [Vitis vinifera]|uniref:Retrovirus-related Pol polyprotein from transposon RE2 n=1 Tax=Vitis vinifera TaxID=29760 RepID=A0A438I315_VITVI|nr:hypothetical protein CK203_039900 [Vitis vinifera]